MCHLKIKDLAVIQDVLNLQVKDAEVNTAKKLTVSMTKQYIKLFGKFIGHELELSGVFIKQCRLANVTMSSKIIVVK